MQPVHLFARHDAMHFSFFSSFARRFFPRKGATPSTRRMLNAATSDRLRELHRLGDFSFFTDDLRLRSNNFRTVHVPHRFRVIYDYLRIRSGMRMNRLTTRFELFMDCYQDYQTLACITNKCCKRNTAKYACV